jgi:hypothetical protein
VRRVELKENNEISGHTQFVSHLPASAMAKICRLTRHLGIFRHLSFPVADAAVDPRHDTSVTPVAIDPTDPPLGTAADDTHTENDNFGFSFWK